VKKQKAKVETVATPPTPAPQKQKVEVYPEDSSPVIYLGGERLTCQRARQYRKELRRMSRASQTHLMQWPTASTHRRARD
jgi:hypothetical protein